ncbi:MAG: glutaminase A [Bacillota bacterium]|nr:glutaminase A [Bacillota bacterium]
MNLDQVLERAYEYGTRYIHKGKVAEYIPELAKEDKGRASAVIFDREGRIFQVGDSTYRFSMQSIVKVVIYLSVLENYEFSHIKKYVGVKPSSKPFNSILELELSNKSIPVNPFINAGAIVATSLLFQKYGERSFDMILDKVRLLLGDPQASLSESIYRSEKSSAFANRALTYMMLSHKIIPAELNVEHLLDVYFKSCSIMVDTVGLGRLSQVLSRDGMSIEGARLIAPEHAKILRTVMASCGTYDYSGDFAIRIGIPAKSGVGGGIVTASKAGYGIAVYCPGLDTHGNSYVGTRMLQSISRDLELSIY